MDQVRSKQPPPQSFTPLEYWKPPKAFRHHIRAKSSALFAPGGKGERFGKERHSFAKLEEGKVTADPQNNAMAFATLGEMVGRSKDGVNEQINMMGKPPAYQIDADDTLHHPWYNVKYWGKKAWLITLGVVAAILIIIVVAVVETEKANAYPNYSKLTYSLAENCKCMRSTSSESC